MTASAKKRDLALYRLKEAEESLDEAQSFYEGIYRLGLRLSKGERSHLVNRTETVCWRV